MKKVSKIMSLLLAVLMIATMGITASAKEQLNYVVLGDSIGWGAGVLNSTEACFGKIVADTNGYNFTNDAVNGYRTTDLINHLDKENIKKDVAEADIISISIGGNDFLMGNIMKVMTDAQNGDYTLMNEILEKFNENFAVIISKIKAINPDATILMQTLYNPNYDDFHDVYQMGIDGLNSGYRNYLKANPGAFEIVEVAAALDGNRDNIAQDSIHPSAKGNVEIAKVVLAKLYDLGLGENTEPVINSEGIDQSEMFSPKFFKYIIKTIIERINAVFAKLASIICIK